MKNPTLSKPHKLFSPVLTGFTLVEVLTVIAIISVLMTAGAIGLGNLTAGKGTSSAIATCESLFEEARTIAVSKRCKARVLIDIDDPENDNYLRRVVVAHEKIEDDGTVDEGNWVLSSRGYTMPTGTFFSREFSQRDPSGRIDEERMTLTGQTGNKLSEYSGKEYAVYEFNREGIFSEPGASFIIGAGIRPQKGEPRTTAGAERDFAGFVIWRNGRTSSYRSPNQMDIPSSVENF